MEFDKRTERLAEERFVISLAGEVDLHTAPDFKEELLAAIAEGGKEIVVDFSEATFIDSTTLGVLIEGGKRLRPAGGRLALVLADRTMLRVFEVTGLDRVFAIYPTRAEAVAWLEAPSEDGR